MVERIALTTNVSHLSPVPNDRRRNPTPHFLLTLLLHLTLLTTTSHGYVTYNEPPSSKSKHPHGSTLHRYPSIPSSHAGPPLFKSHTQFTSNVTDSYQLNLYLGPIGNLHLCNNVHFYDTNGRPIQDPPARNLRGGSAPSSGSQADHPPPPSSSSFDATDLGILIQRGGGCTTSDKIRKVVEGNVRHGQEGGPRVRFILLYDYLHDEGAGEPIDRDDGTLLEHNSREEEEEGVWIIYMNHMDGYTLRRLIEDFGDMAYPTLARYPPFLLNDDTYKRRCPWQFHVAVDGNYLHNKPKPKPKQKPRVEWKNTVDDEEEEEEEL